MQTHNDETYSSIGRFLHWLTVFLLVVLFTSGIAMTYRGDELGLWDATTNTLYSTHKAVGLLLLAIVVLRLGYRLFHGVPQAPSSLSSLQKLAADGVHWVLYVLLLIVPILGWIGISMFPALDAFGIQLPALVAADRLGAEWVFELHETLGDLMLLFIAVHVGAAMFHVFILKDGIMQRMWPRRPG